MPPKMPLKSENRANSRESPEKRERRPEALKNGSKHFKSIRFYQEFVEKLVTPSEKWYYTARKRMRLKQKSTAI